MVEEPEESIQSTLFPTKGRSRGGELIKHWTRMRLTRYDSQPGIFAVPLWDLLQREESAVPDFIIAALELIEAKGTLV